MDSVARRLRFARREVSRRSNPVAATSTNGFFAGRPHRVSHATADPNGTDHAERSRRGLLALPDFRLPGNASRSARHAQSRPRPTPSIDALAAASRLAPRTVGAARRDSKKHRGARSRGGLLQCHPDVGVARDGTSWSERCRDLREPPRSARVRTERCFSGLRKLGPRREMACRCWRRRNFTRESHAAVDTARFAR
jgi:hypothetical protein